MSNDLVTSDSQGRASFADPGDLDLFLEMLGKFERGEISPEAWRAFRLVHGTYGQRQDGDVHMLRVKIPQGVLSARQLQALADVAESSSRGFGHLTTRQNFQLHFVKLADAELALRRLAQAGLTTREACGNSVRNVTACPFAGVAPGETFDVSPYAEALTRHFLRHPLSSSLPRKFKIAFEGCPEDHVALAIHDLGFFALARGDDGKRGFRVVAGGGTAALPTSASVLFECRNLVGWAEAMAGCTHAAHVASPIAASAPRHEDEMIVPAREGTLQTLTDAGAELLANSCGMCAGYGEHLLPDDAVAISTTARNFKGRMGSASAQVYLASPYTVAASAVAGRIADPRELLA